MESLLPQGVWEYVKNNRKGVSTNNGKPTNGMLMPVVAAICCVMLFIPIAASASLIGDTFHLKVTSFGPASEPELLVDSDFLIVEPRTEWNRRLESSNHIFLDVLGDSFRLISLSQVQNHLFPLLWELSDLDWADPSKVVTEITLKDTYSLVSGFSFTDHSISVNTNEIVSDIAIAEFAIQTSDSSTTPEPSTLVLFGVGFLGILGYFYGRKRRFSVGKF
jgi:hypothetical protein